MHYFEALSFLNRDCEVQQTDYFSENFNCEKGENFMLNFLELPCLGEKKMIQLTSTVAFLLYKPRNR